MSNHPHVVAKPDPSVAAQLSDVEVVMRWWLIKHDVDVDDLAQVDQRPSDGVIAALVAKEGFVDLWRGRLGEIGWFMKSLKEPLSRLANKEDGCTGAFWEGRFSSVPLLDEQAIVACMAYVDLNPIRAQLAWTPETSEHTSVKARKDDRRVEQASGSRV